jgi:hypothetical protein
LLSILRDNEVTSVVQVTDHLYRPDLVERLLKGDWELRHEGAARDLNLQAILDSGPAPQIERVVGRAPERAGDTVRLSARVVDTGGGIANRIVWRVNDITQGDLTPPKIPGSSGTSGYRIVEQTLKIDLSKKRNRVEVVAYNERGLLASLPLRFEIDDYITTEPRPKMYVMSIGVSAYANKDWKLTYAETDAKAIARALNEVASPMYDKVIPLTLVDDQVNASGIDASFRALKEQVAASDIFVLFVAGHGRSPTGTYYYLPQDLAFGTNLKTGAIGQDQWQAWLAMIPAQNSVLVFDTCESAAATGLSRGGSERAAAFDRLRFATGRSVITAARQVAYEGYKGHGVLTYAILEALIKLEGAGKEVDLLQVAAYVYRKVPEISVELTGDPQYPHSKIVGNFQLGVRQSGFADPGIPFTPTHALRHNELVRQSPSTDALAARTLYEGQQVRVVSWVGDGNWAKVAKAGQPIGYLPRTSLLELKD